MAKNRKTVWKGFTYLQCDDFAAYLSKMAARGWHFKEWGAGLVFEKGEPENTVYAVEVFFKGSDHDLTPSIETLDFADYCEKAGWKLVDSKQKFCIFKQIRPDAVPISTPQERLQNASKAFMRQLWLQIALAAIWMVNMIMRFVPTNQFINSIFSEITLVLCAYWIFYLLYTIGRLIWFTVWKQKAKQRCRSGEYAVLSHASERVGNLCCWLAIVLYTLAYACVADFILVVVTMSFVLVVLLMGFFISKIRPDRETTIGIQILVSVLATIAIIVASVTIISANEDDVQPNEVFPLYYEDLGVEAGIVEFQYSTDSTSILGSTHYYSLHYANSSLAYTLYETKHDWILDIIWNYQLSWKRNAEPVDCTALWDAQTAYHNGVVEYYVRYDDAILIFHVYDDLVLTQEHIAIIRDALGLEG